MRRALAVTVASLLLLAASSAAFADEDAPVLRHDGDVRFHRTTPRAVLAGARDAIVIGVPAGRAWGIESELRPLPGPDTVLVVRLAVNDPMVREAFVRVAYYGAAPARSRQMAISDSAPIVAGERALVALELDPPPGAVAYRVRVLARLPGGAARSADDAVIAALHFAGRSGWRGGSLFSRLLP